MHRFLKSRLIQNIRVALRSDASIWLMAVDESEFELDRGSGPVRARRIRLCRDDEIQIAGAGVSKGELCNWLGIDFDQARDATEQNSNRTGDRTLVPVSVPADVIEDARRNPDTGQIESSTKEPS